MLMINLHGNSLGVSLIFFGDSDVLKSLKDVESKASLDWPRSRVSVSPQTINSALALCANICSPDLFRRLSVFYTLADCDNGGGSEADSGGFPHHLHVRYAGEYDQERPFRCLQGFLTVFSWSVRSTLEVYWNWQLREEVNLQNELQRDSNIQYNATTLFAPRGAARGRSSYRIVGEAEALNLEINSSTHDHPLLQIHRINALPIKFAAKLDTQPSRVGIAATHIRTKLVERRPNIHRVLLCAQMSLQMQSGVRLKKFEENKVSAVTLLSKAPWNVDSQQLKQCWTKPVSKDTEPSKGFIVFSLTNGPDHHVSQLADAVVIARYVNATLVLPDIRGSEPGQKRKFQDMYDVDKFMRSLDGVITIVKELPPEVTSRSPAVVRVPNRASEDFIVKKIEPIFRAKGYLRLATYFPSVNLKLREKKNADLASTTCLAMFGSLELKPEIQELVDMMAGSLRTLNQKSNGCFVAIDLKTDFLEKKICKQNGFKQRKSCYNAQEIAEFLKKMGFDGNTTIYLTQTWWHESLNFFREIFPNTYIKMELQNTPMTVQLGQGARIQLTNAIIETGNVGATIQFGSLDFPAVVARTTVVPVSDMNTGKPARRLHPSGAPTHRMHLPAQRPAAEELSRRTSVFERLSQSEVPTIKRTLTGGIISVVTANTTSRPTGLSVPREYDPETSSSGGRLTRRQRRKRNAELRAQQQFSTHPSNGLTKRRFQRPLTADVRRTPPRERLSFARVERRERRNNPLGEHRGVTPELRIRGSTTERSRWKGKQSWRPKPRRGNERKEREIDLGVTSGVASRRSAPDSRDRQRWVQKKAHDDSRYDGRHLGESSRGSCHSPTPPKEEVNFDRSPRVEEILLPNKEPEIQWRRRSEIRLLEEGENMEENMKEDTTNIEYMEGEEEMNDTINMEIVYMARHVNIDNGADYDDGEDDGDWQPHPQQEYQRQHEAGSIADEGDRSPRGHEMEAEDNPFDDENATLAEMRRQMRRQMRAKDREISQLNEKMTEMMAQMTAIMQMMQRNVIVGPAPTPLVDPPNLQMPQISGIRGIPGNGQGAQNTTRQPTPQNIASTSEPVTAAQVAKFEKLNLSKSESHFDKPKKAKSSDTKKRETYSTSSLRSSKGKQVIYNVDKGKQPMQYEEKPKQVYNPNPQPKLILGGNDKPRNFQGGGERPRQNVGTGDRTFPSLKDKMNKEY
ncbi:hypothetical protein M5K25_027821 [Dendrobium thyrsiflorum]|uniref:O-fucosyltransferase family protein n=1 Tax=Dendrobium thyrsiflorum TaxID=117978 RepID=A0ABD0TUT6_DENTH